MAALMSGKFASLELLKSTAMVVLPNGVRERLSKVAAKFVRIGRTAMRGSGHGMWRGQKVKFSLKSNGTPDVPDAGLPFEIVVAGRIMSFSLKGEARSKGKNGLHLKGTGEIKTGDLRRLARALGAHWPGSLNLRDFSISGPFVWAGSALLVPKATVKFDDNEGAGALSINTDGKKALLSGTLAFDEFDLAAYFGADANAGAKGYSVNAITQWVRRLAGAWTMPMVHHADADLRVSAKLVRVGDIRIGPAATAITLKSGKVSVNLAELAFDGGTGTGQLSIDFNGLMPQLALRGRLTTAPVGQLSKALFGIQYLKGSGTITADLVAHGDTLKQMLGNISGTIDTEMPSGGLVGLDLSVFDIAAGTALIMTPQSQAGEVMQRALLGKVTRLKHVSASFLLTNGRVLAKDVSVSFADRVARFAGRFDAGTQRMEVRMLIKPAAASIMTAGGVQANATAAVSKPVRGCLLVVRGKWGRGKWEAAEIRVSGHQVQPTELDKLLRLSPETKFRKRI